MNEVDGVVMAVAGAIPEAASLIVELRHEGLGVALIVTDTGLAPGGAPLAGVVVLAGSPDDPGVFAAAAARLGLDPGLCLAVTDGPAGVDAALAAGIWTIGVGPATRFARAHAVVPSLAGLGWAGLRGLVEDAAWTIRRPVSPTADHHLETLLTIGNGHFAVRGTTLEGRPGEDAASFMHGVWDDMPVSRTELANLPRWWGMDLWVNGARLGRDGTPGDGVWSLDLRTGLLTRTLTWIPDASTEVALTDERFCSLGQPHAAAVRLTVKAIRGQASVGVRSGLDVHVDNLGLRHWDLVDQAVHGLTVEATTRTRATRTELSACAVLRSDEAAVESCEADGQPAILLSAIVSEGQTWQATKYVALASTEERFDPRTRVAEIAASAAHTGWDEMARANRAAWDRVWDASDVRIDGDPAAQLALRYNLFQLVIAAPQIADASIGAKTLSGFGYRHHVFWDTEIFMLPVFTFTQPEMAARMLAYRWRRLPGARRKALACGGGGARFPWESAGTGDEVCPTWVENPADPAHPIRIWTGDLELHLNADLAYACLQYWRVAGDDDFMRKHGVELICDTATFWATTARLEDDGCYHFRDVIGPDEYHEHADDNAFTNAMAAWHLRWAPRVLAWLDQAHPDDAASLRARLGIDADRETLWRRVADAIVPPRERGGVIEQQEGFFGLTDVDVALARDPTRTQSMQQIYGIEATHHTQNLKQPDVLMLAYLLPELFTREQFLANYRYYDPRTDHELGSSLGPSISAIIACRAGDPQAAYAHFRRAAQTDLVDVRGNARDGVHGASAGGLWQAVVFGFAGLSVDDAGWRTVPVLPTGWTRISFSFWWRGKRQDVVVSA